MYSERSGLDKKGESTTDSRAHTVPQSCSLLAPLSLAAESFASMLR